MKIILINKSTHDLKLEIQGEGHTLLNLLNQTLVTKKNVESVGYSIPHRLVDATIFYIKTKGVNPADAIIKASKEIKDSADEFKKALEKALKSKKK